MAKFDIPIDDDLNRIRAKLEELERDLHESLAERKSFRAIAPPLIPEKLKPFIQLQFEDDEMQYASEIEGSFTDHDCIIIAPADTEDWDPAVQGLALSFFTQYAACLKKELAGIETEVAFAKTLLKRIELTLALYYGRGMNPDTKKRYTAGDVKIHINTHVLYQSAEDNLLFLSRTAAEAEAIRSQYYGVGEGLNRARMKDDQIAGRSGSWAGGGPPDKKRARRPEEVFRARAASKSLKRLKEQVDDES